MPVLAISMEIRDRYVHKQNLNKKLNSYKFIRDIAESNFATALHRKLKLIY